MKKQSKKEDIMLYTINFTVFGDDNSREDLTRRVLTDSMAEAEAAVLGAYGNSVTINTISIKNIK
jgi:hypothetical protein